MHKRFTGLSVSNESMMSTTRMKRCIVVLVVEPSTWLLGRGRGKVSSSSSSSSGTFGSAIPGTSTGSGIFGSAVPGTSTGGRLNEGLCVVGLTGGPAQSIVDGDIVHELRDPQLRAV